jgi:thymidylate kinase
MISKESFARQMLLSLNEEKITYCVLRDFVQLETGIDHDVDLFVSARDLCDFEHVLFKFCEHNQGEVVKQISYQDYKAYIVQIDTGADEFYYFKIDVWTDFFWRGLTWFDNAIVEDNITHVSGLSVANNSLALAIRVLKDLIFTSKLPSRSISRVQNEFENIVKKGELDKFESLFPSANARKIINCLKKSKYSELSRDSRRIRWSQVKANLIGVGVLSSIKQTCLFLSDKLNAVIKPPGLLIVLLGPDGSGKSTLAQTIKDGAGNNLFNGCNLEYSRPNLLPQINRFTKIFGSRNKNQISGYDLNSDDKVSEFKGTIQILYYTLDFFLGRLLIKYYLFQGRLVLYDRYFYDYMIQTYWDNVSDRLKKVCSKLMATPDIVFLLLADPKDIYARKPELNIAVIAQQQQRIKELQVKSPVAIVSSSGPINISTNAILKVIFRELLIREKK